MIEEELPIYAIIHNGYWIDLGTPKTYRQAQADAMERKIRLKSFSSNTPEGPLVIPPVHMGQGCEIAKGSQIGPHAVLGNQCRIRSGAVVENFVLWDSVTVGTNATVQNSIIGTKVSINSDAQVKDSLVVA